jgi:hypothetical protein
VLRSPVPTALLTALAALAAIAALAAHDADAVSAAEGTYLGRLAAGVLLAVALLVPSPAWEAGWGAALTVAAVWALPAGPGRGAVVVALLAGTLTIASCRRLRRLMAVGEGTETAPALRAPVSGRGEEAPPAVRAGGTAINSLIAAGALCCGWQVLLRGELLFAPGHAVRPWMALLALPPAAGAALALFWRRHGVVPALAAAGTAAVLAPGWTVGTTLAFLALAGGCLLASNARARETGRGGPSRPAWLPPNARARETGGGPATRALDEDEGGAAGAGSAGRPSISPPPAAGRALGLFRGRPWLARLRLAAGIAALLLPVAWQPRSGWAAAVAGLALWSPGVALALAVPLGLACQVAASHAPPGLPLLGTGTAGVGVAWLLMLVPAFLLQVLPALQVLTAHGRRRAAMLAVAVVLAGTVPWLPDRSALAAPLALAALTLPAGGIAAGLSAVWSSALLLGTALLASYPWLRQDPLGDTMALLGCPPGPRLTGGVALAALLLAGAVALLRRVAPGWWRGARPARAPANRPASEERRDGPPPATPGAAAADSRLTARMTTWAAARAATWTAAWAAGAAILLTLAAPRLVRPSTALLPAGASVLLDRDHPSWQTDLGPRPTGGVVVVTSLIHAAGLAPGTPAARVRLLGTGGVAAEWSLRAGLDTGEWAARRPDVAASARLPAPRPWQRWVAGDFFGQSYRARLALPRSASFVRLEIDLAPGLPVETGLALHQVESAP